MSRWVKFALFTLIVAVGAIGLWWQMTIDASVLKLSGHTFHATVLTTNADLQKGLSGTSNIASDAAMLFVFDGNTIPVMWMKDMNYPIDMVWVDGGKVVHIEQNVQPSSYDSKDPDKSVRYRSDGPARYVIELKSGIVKEVGLKLGDKVQLPLGLK